MMMTVAVDAIMTDAGPCTSGGSVVSKSGSAFNMFKGLQYRLALSEIAAKLNPDDMKTIRFICKAVDGLTKRDLELEDPLDLFVKLEERGVISCENTDFLRELLIMVHRQDCVTMLDEYERGSRNGTHRVSTDAAWDKCSKESVDRPNSHTIKGPILQPTEGSMGEDLSGAFDIVVEELGRDWRQLARKLQITEVEIDYITEDHVRNLREQSMQCLLLWKKKMRTKATKAALIEALKRCGMMYISDRLEGLQVR